MGSTGIAFDHVHIISRAPEACVEWFVENLGGERGTGAEYRGAPQIPVQFGGVTVIVRGERNGRERGARKMALSGGRTTSPSASTAIFSPSATTSRAKASSSPSNPRSSTRIRKSPSSRRPMASASSCCKGRERGARRLRHRLALVGGSAASCVPLPGDVGGRVGGSLPRAWCGDPVAAGAPPGSRRRSRAREQPHDARQGGTRQAALLRDAHLGRRQGILRYVPRAEAGFLERASVRSGVRGQAHAHERAHAHQRRLQRVSLLGRTRAQPRGAGERGPFSTRARWRRARRKLPRRSRRFPNTAHASPRRSGARA